MAVIRDAFTGRVKRRLAAKQVEEEPNSLAHALVMLPFDKAAFCSDPEIFLPVCGHSLRSALSSELLQIVAQEQNSFANSTGSQLTAGYQLRDGPTGEVKKHARHSPAHEDWQDLNVGPFPCGCCLRCWVLAHAPMESWVHNPDLVSKSRLFQELVGSCRVVSRK